MAQNVIYSCMPHAIDFLLHSDKVSIVARALVEDSSRQILASIISTAKTIEEISEETKIPLSSCYKIIRELEENKIASRCKSIVTGKGKKSGLYVSNVRNATIRFVSGDLSVDLEPEAAPIMNELASIPA